MKATAASDNTSALGLKTRDASYGFGVLATDYNGDGWVDIFIANDTNANYLFRNRGNGTFDEVALASGVAFNADGRAAEPEWEWTRETPTATGCSI